MNDEEIKKEAKEFCEWIKEKETTLPLAIEQVGSILHNFQQKGDFRLNESLAGFSPSSLEMSMEWDMHLIALLLWRTETEVKKAREEERKRIFRIIEGFPVGIQTDLGFQQDILEEIKSGETAGSLDSTPDGVEAGSIPVLVKAGSNPAPAKRLKGWCAFNRGDPEIDNMSFEKTKKEILRCWGKHDSQELRKCEVLIFGMKGDKKHGNE